jgi:hypothetical protein
LWSLVFATAEVRVLESDVTIGMNLGRTPH